MTFCSKDQSYSLFKENQSRQFYRKKKRKIHMKIKAPSERKMISITISISILIEFNLRNRKTVYEKSFFTFSNPYPFLVFDNLPFKNPLSHKELQDLVYKPKSTYRQWAKLHPRPNELSENTRLPVLVNISGFFVGKNLCRKPI